MLRDSCDTDIDIFITFRNCRLELRHWVKLVINYYNYKYYNKIAINCYDDNILYWRQYYIEDGTYNIFCGEQILKCDV